MLAHLQTRKSDLMEEVVREGLEFGSARGPLVMDSALIQAFFARLLKQGEEPERLEELACYTQENKDFQAFLYRTLDANGSAINSTLELENAVKFQKEHPGWWEQNFESFFERLSEDQRAQIQNEWDRTGHDITVGVVKGAYTWAKGGVVLVVDVVNLCINLVDDESTRAKARELAKEAAIYALIYYCGTDQMRAAMAKKITDKIGEIFTALANSMMEDWEKADAEGKRDELAAKWLTTGLLDWGTVVLGVVKGAKAIKVAKELAEEAAQLGVKKGEKAVAREVAEESRESLSKQSLTKTSELADAKTSIAKVTGKLTKAEIGMVHRAIGPAAAKRLKAAKVDVKEKIQYSLLRFIRSSTNRSGVLTGAEYLAKHPRVGEIYVKRAIRTLEEIKSGKGVEVFTTVPEKYVADALAPGMKGQKFKDYAKADLGRANRFGTGKYYSVAEHKTSRLEVFPTSKYDQTGKLISKRGQVPEGYSILKAQFQPSNGLKGDFLIVPSVRRPRGLNIVDLENTNLRNYTKAEELWKIERP